MKLRIETISRRNLYRSFSIATSVVFSGIKFRIDSSSVFSSTRQKRFGAAVLFRIFGKEHPSRGYRETHQLVDDRFTPNHFTRRIPYGYAAPRNIIDVNSRKATARGHKENVETRYRVASTRFSGFPPVNLPRFVAASLAMDTVCHGSYKEREKKKNLCPCLPVCYPCCFFLCDILSTMYFLDF